MAENKESELHDSAVRLGKAGGKKGGPARARKLTDEEKSEIARLGGLAKAAKDKQTGKKKTKGLSIKTKLKKRLKKPKSKK